MGITSATNGIIRRYNLTNTRFYKSPARRRLQQTGTNSNYWGIYADTKYAAKAIAFALKSDNPPEVHGKGYYGYYHDKNHLIHVWYGSPQNIIYEILVAKAWEALK